MTPRFTIGIILIISSFKVADSFYCLECDAVSQPRHCHTVKKCPQDYACVVEKYLSVNGEYLYNVGCKLNSTCIIQNENTTSSKRSDLHPDKVTCTKCCTGDLCNAEGCGEPGYPEDRGPVCFNCQQRNHPELCEGVKVCDRDQICILSTEVEFGDVTYTSHCEPIHICQALQGSPGVVGKRSIPRPSTSCCSSDLCNNGTNYSPPIYTVPTAAPTTTRIPSAGGGAMGTEFVLVFPINYKSNKKVHLYIVSKEKTFTGNVTSPYTTVNQNFSTSNGYKTVSLSPNVQLSEGRSDKVIYVKTDKPVSVYGFDTYSCCSGEAFNVLPKPFLGRHYIAFSVDPHFDSYLVIISTAQGTKVSINWKLSKYVTVEGNRYLNGDKMTLTIDDMESIQILSTGDITGTTITSTNPVAVSSGNKCPDLTSSSACNQIIEYLQPSEKCGRRFIIPPMYGDRDSTKLLKVVATANRTRLTIRGGSLKVNRTIDMDDVDKTRLKMYETYAVEATENVCVIVAADIGHSTNDPVLTQVPALGQFVHEVVIPKPTIETFSNYVSIVANSSALSDLRINNQAPVTNDLKRITIDFAEYVSFWTPLENGTSTYHINATSPTSYFGVIAHGSKHSQAYAFPVGLKLG